MALKSTMNVLKATLEKAERYRTALEEIVQMTHHERSHLARMVNDVAFKALTKEEASAIEAYLSAIEDGGE